MACYRVSSEMTREWQRMKVDKEKGGGGVITEWYFLRGSHFYDFLRFIF